ncbi:L-fucose:H+ symporter permease [Zhouia sp. PK063]|uniref:L-fucose:H+ symporter permease n=1 Tax=Zhouia sp. PK063 TaxID=3373602 RepID=UPI003797ED69
MKQDKTIPLVPRKLLLPFVLITSLFSLWGFANAVTDPMVQAFKKVLELSNSEAAWVQMAFYGGYFCMALPAALFVRRYSYKSGILIGLALYAVGALLFYPATISQQFWFFCLGLYILTFGLAFLETTANPYILAMGREETAIQRLNLAQVFNPIGNILGLLVAQYFVLKELQSDDISNFEALSEVKKVMIRTSDLMVIRDPYVILGIVVLGVFFMILLNKMPQAKNENVSESLAQTLIKLKRNKKYVFGVLSQILYVGAQIMCWTYIYQYSEAINITADVAANYQFIAFVLFFIGRGLGTYLLRYLSSEKLLAYFALVAIICTSVTIFFSGSVGLLALVGISFCMSVMFPTIYGIALEGLKEEEAKIGAAGLVMAIVGGALMPKLQGIIIDLGGVKVNDIKILGVTEVNFSFILPWFCFLGILTYAVMIKKLKKENE